MVAEQIPLFVLTVVLALDILPKVACVKDGDILHILHDSRIHAVYRLKVVASFGALGTRHIELCKFVQCGRDGVEEAWMSYDS